MITFFIFLLKEDSQTVLQKWWLFLVRTEHIPHEMHYQPHLWIFISVWNIDLLGSNFYIHFW